MEDAGLEDLGVAPSQVEDRRYLPRPAADERIRTSLTGARFVVLVGESAAGKSRTAIEAVRQLWPRHTLVAPIRSGLRAGVLERIVELVKAPQSPVILWLDDLEQYLAASALTVDMLSKWAGSSPKVTVLATMQTVQWGYWRFPSVVGRPGGKKAARRTQLDRTEVNQVAHQAAAVLSQATRVELPRTLETAEERAEATRRYGAHDWTALGVGEVLAAGPELLAKLRDGRGSHPWGWAIAQAAADWRRAGVGRPISTAELEGLSVLYLPQWAAQTEDFGAGLAWITAPVKPGSDVRIISPRFREGQAAHYESHDYVTASRERTSRSLPKQVWHWLIACQSLNAHELMRIGSTAQSRQEPDVALAAYDRTIDRYGDAPDIELRRQVAIAMSRKGALLDDQGELNAAIAAFDQVVERFGKSSDLRVRLEVASALVRKGFVVRRQGLLSAAIAVHDQVVERFGDAPESAIRSEVARALASAGVMRLEQGDVEAALVSFDQVVERYGASQDLFLNHSVAMALLSKGIVFQTLVGPEAASELFDEIERRYGEARVQLLHEPVAMALVSKGLLLASQGRPDAAIAVYERVEKRYGASPAPELRQQVASALVNKGAALGEQGQSAEAVAVYDQVVERYGDAPEPALREAVAKARQFREDVSPGRPPG